MLNSSNRVDNTQMISKLWKKLSGIIYVDVTCETGECYKWMKICKDEKVGNVPFKCGKAMCDKYCANKHSADSPHAWGKCNDDNLHVCECYFICFKDSSTGCSINNNIQVTSHSNIPSPSAPPKPWYYSFFYIISYPLHQLI